MSDEIIPGWWAAPDDLEYGAWGVWRRVRTDRGEQDQLIVGCIPEGMARHWANSDRMAAALRSLVEDEDEGLALHDDDGVWTRCVYCLRKRPYREQGAFPHAEDCAIPRGRAILARLDGDG